MKEKFNVLGMSCAACQGHVEKAVKNVEGVSKVEVNLLKGTMNVEYDENKTSSDAICSAVNKAGYRALTKNAKPGSQVIQAQNDHKLARLIASFVLLMLVMYVSMGNMMWGWPLPKVFDMHHNPMGFALLQFLLTLPIIYLNRNYFISGTKKLIKRSPNMDSLIAIGAFASIVYGIIALFMISMGNIDYVHNLYIESAGMILTLVSMGKYFEELSKRRTTDAITKLINLKPKTALVLRNGQEIEIKAEEVRTGDIVIIKKGNIIPVDGKIIEGSIACDEANITGESMPRELSVDDEVFASTTVLTGYAKLEALKVGADTKFENIIKLVDEASSSKAPISRLADKISGIFVPTILIISLLTFIINYIVHKDFELSFRFAITVVVIACPCALGLATPVAIMVSTGRAALNGLLIRNADILERSHLIKTVVMDKTGTITEGKPRVLDFVSYEGDNLLNIIYSIEAKSEHPLSNAVVEYAKANNASLVEISEYEAVEAKGVKAIYNNDTYFIGNYSIYTGESETNVKTKIDELSNQGKTPLIITKNNLIVGILSVRDEPKASSLEAIKLLKERGIRVIMLTGDNKKTAEAIANEIGVDEVIADVYPEDKQKIIASLKHDKKHLVAMVGDGVNDAPALATADLGIAIGSGSDIALESSDIVLLNNSLVDVVNVIRLSGRTLNTIKLNLFWAFFYNLICVSIATGMFMPLGLTINPMIGSIAMSFSSVSVVLSSLTINFFKPIKFEGDKKCCNIDGTCSIEEKKEVKENMEEMIISVEGMMCKMCKAHVEKACNAINGVKESNASVEDKNVTVKGENLNRDELIKAIKEAGYEAK